MGRQEHGSCAGRAPVLRLFHAPHNALARNRRSRLPAAEVVKKSRLLSIATPMRRSFFPSHGAPNRIGPRRDGKPRPSNCTLVRRVKQEITEGYPERPRSFSVVVLESQAAHSPQPRRRSGARAGHRAHVAKGRAAALGKRRIAFRQNPLPLFGIDIAVGACANAGSASRANHANYQAPLRKSPKRADVSGFTATSKRY